MLYFHYDNNFSVKPERFHDLILYQLGEMRCDGSDAPGTHTHGDWFEFTYVFDGKGQIWANGIPTDVSKDMLYFSHPAEVHKITSDPESPLHFFFFSFRFDPESQFFPLLGELRNQTADERKRAYKAGELAGGISHLLSDVKFETDLDRSVLEMSSKLCILRAIRIMNQERGFVYVRKEGDGARSLGIAAIRYIGSHLHNIETASDVASALGYQYAYLSRCFRKTIGIPLSDYLTERKLEEAKDLLRERQTPITEIAELLHYGSVYSFSRAFSRYCGISPTAFRKESQAGRLTSEGIKGSV